METYNPRLRKTWRMYIFPGCIADVNRKLVNKDDTRSPNDKKF